MSKKKKSKLSRFKDTIITSPVTAWMQERAGDLAMFAAVLGISVAVLVASLTQPNVDNQVKANLSPENKARYEQLLAELEEHKGTSLEDGAHSGNEEVTFTPAGGLDEHSGDGVAFTPVGGETGEETKNDETKNDETETNEIEEAFNREDVEDIINIGRDWFLVIGGKRVPTTREELEAKGLVTFCDLDPGCPAVEDELGK